MVNGLLIHLCRTAPSLENLQDEEIESVDQVSIDYLAFEVGEALDNQRRRHEFGLPLGQAESLKLVDFAARAIADSYDRLRQFKCRNGDDALLGCAQCGKAVISVADNTGYERRFKVDHHMPRHCHDVGAALAGCREQNYRTWFKQLVNLRQRQILHLVRDS